MKRILNRKTCIIFLIALIIAISVVTYLINNQNPPVRSNSIQVSKKTAEQAPVYSPAPEKATESVPATSQASNEEVVTQARRNIIAKVRKIFDNYFEVNDKRNVDALMSFYGDKVDYFRTGIVDKNFIRKDKISYFKRWTISKTTMIGEPEIDVQDDDIISVRFITNWMVQNNEKKISGTADNVLKLKQTNEGIKIIDEKQQVTSRNR